MQRLVNSWNIFRKSLRLIRQNRKLLLFPALSFLALIGLFVLVFGGIVFSAITGGAELTSIFIQKTVIDGKTDYALSIPGLVVFAVLYLVFMTLANYCNVAFCSEIIRGLRGEEVSIGRAFRFANSRIKAIFLWSVLAATIGLILKLLEERFGSLLGRIAVALCGAAWAIASVFAIPALVCDETLVNPLEALKRSAATIKRTWGESLVGFVGFVLLNFLVMLAGILLFILSVVAAASLQWSGTSAVMGLSVLGFLIFSALMVYFYLIGIARSIYIAALYCYANGEPHVADFTPAELEGAFRVKKK